jgi:adenylate kinase
MRIVLLGPPGAGKGTQASTLAESQGVPHVASGDLFREHQLKGTELGQLVRSYIEQGQLVPDEVTIRMINQRIDEPDCVNGVVLDGFPRTTAQATALGNLFESRGSKLERVLYIRVSEEELVQRLGGRILCRGCQTPYNLVSLPPKTSGLCDRCGGELYQRPDDTPEAVRNRIRVYLEETAPLIDYYREKGILREVDGEQKVDQVAKALHASLEG